MIRRLFLLVLLTTTPEALGRRPPMFVTTSSNHKVRPRRRAIMMTLQQEHARDKPSLRPDSPHFSSGPTKKRPGYSVDGLPTGSLGRSHRSTLGRERLRYAINLSKSLLGLPQDYVLGIVPGGDTGAYEMALWNLMGERPVDVLVWDAFGAGWRDDLIELGLPNGPGLKVYTAPYGSLPELDQVDPTNDCCFTWNGTTSGVCLPDGGSWISPHREGLTVCDATSAIFCMPLPWDRLDVVTYSWQKALGGEGAHGVIILSPRAIHRLQTYRPQGRPIPKLFRLHNAKDEVDMSVFDGSTINTPSMLCVEDYIDALEWTNSQGGVQALIDRTQANLKIMEEFVSRNSNWVSFLAKDPKTRSSTSVCLIINATNDQLRAMVARLEKEGVAYDIASYRDAPPGLRVWCGPTVESSDIKALTSWLQWAYESTTTTSR